MNPKPTEKLILDAAIKVFTEKGFAAARTEDIAKAAGINRALLHYYYRDKQTIFNLTFESRFLEFFKGLFEALGTSDPLLRKIERIVDHEISILIKHPDLPRFIIMEVAQHPELLIEHGQKLGLNPRVLLAEFEKLVTEEIARGTLRPIAGRTLLINIMSLCVYPFVAQPILTTLMQLDIAAFHLAMEERKKEVYEFIVHAITRSV